MTATERFIQDAISGGWLLLKSDRTTLDEAIAIAVLEPEHILLDPLSWQAVGKVRGWKEFRTEVAWVSEDLEQQLRIAVHAPEWFQKMSVMTLWLAEGKTIEQYLLSIETTV